MGKVTQAGKISPFQPEYSNLYQGPKDEFAERMLQYCALSRDQFPAVSHSSEKFSIDEMASPFLETQFLRFLIAANGAKRVLEIGTFVGATTLALAQALPADGLVVTIEKGEEFAEIAARNFAASSLASRISLRQGDAAAVLPALASEARFDLIFLDAAKQIYGDLFSQCVSLLSPRGIVVVDDVFFHGDVFNQPPTTEKGAGARDFIERISRDPSWRKCLLPIFNGMLLLTR